MAREAFHLNEAQPPLIRIVLVDDHEVVRIGVRALLEHVAEFGIIGEAATMEEAVTLVDRLAEGDASQPAADAPDTRPASPPDIVLMDVRLPDGSGIDACRAIKEQHSEVKVIMLTSYSDDQAVLASIQAGASGYLLKQVGSDELIQAIKTAHAGDSVLDVQTTGRLFEQIRTNRLAVNYAVPAPRNSITPGQNNHGLPVAGLGKELSEPLSEQERRILARIAEGKTNREIAEDVYLSEKTVRNYVSNILGKLDLSNRAEAAAFAVKHGIDLPPGTGRKSSAHDGGRQLHQE